MKIKMISLLILFCSITLAKDTKTFAETIAECNQLYNTEQYESALKEYGISLVDDPKSPLINFNMGDTFYRLENYESAFECFQKGLNSSDPIIESKAHYNIGNCLVKQGKLKEALVSYKRALKLKRDDIDTKFNIEFVQKKLKEKEDKKKKKDPEDPLKKILKRLEKLISLQAKNLLATKEALAPTDIIAKTIYTNEINIGIEAISIQDAFKSLFTNLPPEQLKGISKQDAQLQNKNKINVPAETEELMLVFKELARTANSMQSALTNNNGEAILGYLTNGLVNLDINFEYDANQEYGQKAKKVVANLANIFINKNKNMEADLRSASLAFNNLMQELQTTLKQQVADENPAMAGASTPKTLAMKITNAVEFIQIANFNVDKSCDHLQTVFSNAVPFETESLDYLIKARKEFDDNQDKKDQDKKDQDKKDQDKKDQDKKDQDKKDQDKKDQDKKDQDKKDQDKKDQDKKDQDKKDQDKKDQDKKDQDKKKQNKQDKKENKQPELDKKQAERMLQNFQEDQKNKRKQRKQKVKASYIPVDKDW